MVPAPAAPPPADQLLVHDGAVELSVLSYGEATADAVVLVPDLGRGAADFDALATALAAAGWRALAVDPRGVGESEGPMDRLSLADFAADIAAVVRRLSGSAAHLVGHGFANRVIRYLATTDPASVRSVTLLGAGGRVAADPSVAHLVERCFDLRLSEDERLAAVRAAFFAPGGDPAVWSGGWWPAAARAQGWALQSSTADHWWHAGDVPILVVQGLDDLLAPPENGRQLAAELPDRVRLVEIPGAGHALLPERPELVAAAVIDFLRSL